jgi:hypothetical protein
MPIGTPRVSIPTNAESPLGVQVTCPIIAPMVFQTVRYWVPLSLAVSPTWVIVPLNVATPA